ncbi:MAG TPA: gamma-glutamyltransferase, partial [bacterium]|nr:gamma-glutamyltransferase [bacterium]
MKSPRFCLFFILPIFLTVSSVFAATGRQAMIATANPYATNAALEILKQGGNAADAAVAAQWVLNVVEPQSSGIGGGGFFLYYEAATKK